MLKQVSLFVLIVGLVIGAVPVSVHASSLTALEDVEPGDLIRGKGDLGEEGAKRPARHRSVEEVGVFGVAQLYNRCGVPQRREVGVVRVGARDHRAVLIEVDPRGGVRPVVGSDYKDPCVLG